MGDEFINIKALNGMIFIKHNKYKLFLAFFLTFVSYFVMFNLQIPNWGTTNYYHIIQYGCAISVGTVIINVALFFISNYAVIRAYKALLNRLGLFTVAKTKKTLPIYNIIKF